MAHSIKGNTASTSHVEEVGEDSDEGEESKGAEDEERLIHVTFLDNNGKVIRMEAAEAVAEEVRLACHLVDPHLENLTTTGYAWECYDLL